MTLTKDDLQQIGKIVRKIVREEVENEVGNAKSDIESRMFELTARLGTQLRDTDNRVKNLEIDMGDVKKQLRKLKTILTSPNLCHSGFNPESTS